MLNQYISNPAVPGNCLHNTANWQVTEYMGGLACEILKKTRLVDKDDALRHSKPLHKCFASVFMQGDDASAFLEELSTAQEKLTPKEVDNLLLSGYSDVLSLD